MSSFTQPLIVAVNGDYTFTLHTQFSYHVGELNSGETIDVPAGFITDFASIPRFLWSVLPPYGRYAAASVIHDWLYKTGGLHGTYTRKRCDAIFLEAMKVLQVSTLTRNVIYRAVRTFGNSSWNVA